MVVRYTGVRELAEAFGRVPIALKRELRPQMRAAGQHILDDMRHRASYSTRIPAATKMTVRFSLKGGGVFFRVNAAQAPEARPLEGARGSTNASSFRHPVFGDRDDWVDQPTQPFFLPAMLAGRVPLRIAMADAIKASLREVKR